MNKSKLTIYILLVTLFVTLRNCLSLNTQLNKINTIKNLKKLSISTLAAAILTQSSTVLAAPSESSFGLSYHSLDEKVSVYYNKEKSSGFLGDPLNYQTDCKKNIPWKIPFASISFPLNNEKLIYGYENDAILVFFGLVITTLLVYFIIFYPFLYPLLPKNESKKQLSSVVTIKLSLTSNWNDKKSVLNFFSQLLLKDDWKRGSIDEWRSGKYSILRKNELKDILNKISFILLRKENDWFSGDINYKYFNDEKDNIVPLQLYFAETVEKEKKKFEKKVIPNFSMNSLDTLTFEEIKLTSIFTPTIVAPIVITPTILTPMVLTLVLATENGGPKFHWWNRSDHLKMKKILTELASPSFSYDVSGLEVLWIPSEVGSNLSEVEMIKDYPRLEGFKVF